MHREREPRDAHLPSAAQVLSSQRIYQGRVVNLRVDTIAMPPGEAVTREVVEHPGAVVIAALDHENNLYCVRQYRHPVGRFLLELPAGGLEPGEDPLSCAKRELKEEVGLSAETWLHLGSFYSSPGFTTEILHSFLACNLAFVEVDPDEDEDIEIVKYPLSEALRNPLAFEDAKTLATLFLLAQGPYKDLVEPE